MSASGSAPPKSQTSRPLMPSLELGRISNHAEEYPCVSRRVRSQRPNISDSAAGVAGAKTFSNAATMIRERRIGVRKPVFRLEVVPDGRKPFHNFTVMLSCDSWDPNLPACLLWVRRPGSLGHRLNSISYSGPQSPSLKNISCFAGMSVIR